MEKQEEIIITPIERLIAFYGEELFNEIAINNDSTEFWKKAQSYLFDNAITSFRESVASLRQGMIEDREMYNYFSAFVFRVFSQPYTDPALNVFSEGFNMIASDPVFFKDTFDWNTSSLGKVELLLLFLCVHRNKIILVLDDKMRLEQERLPTARLAAKGGKR